MSQHSMSHHDQAKHHTLNPLDDVSFGEGIDLAVGLTATALTADQLVKLAHAKKHTTQHLVKGGLTAGLATAAFAMMAREHREKHEHQHHKQEDHPRGRPLVANPHPHPLSDDDGRAVVIARPRSRSSSSTHSTYSEHFRNQDPAHRRSLSPAPSSRRRRSLSPAPSSRRRALSHSSKPDQTFAEKHPQLMQFVEAVGNNLRESGHR